MTTIDQKKLNREVFEQSVADLNASYEHMYDELMDLHNPQDVALMALHEARALRVIADPRLRLLETQMEQVNEKLARLVELAETNTEKGENDEH